MERNGSKTHDSMSPAAHAQTSGEIEKAISTGGFKGKGTDESGKPFDSNERWTDTWVKMPNGKWQCVASHGSNIKK